MRLANYQNRVTSYFNKRIYLRMFKVGEWVLMGVVENIRDPNADKFDQSWERPFEVTKAYGKGVYKLKQVETSQYVARLWNAIHLKKYYV